MLALIGYGKIGKAIKTTLNSAGISIDCFDIVEKDGCRLITDYSVLSSYHTIICSTPYFVNKKIAKFCFDNDINYIDLTEDVETTKFIKSLNPTNISMIPQSGLAPGMINIMAHKLALTFDKVNNIKLRVGALPLYPRNHMKYYFSWNVEGVINEYCNMCISLQNGKITETLPLTEYETLVLENNEYEAFNTSGGVGTLPESWDGKANNIDYKTIRYVGHRDYMKFLADDLNMKDNADLFIELFKREVPETIQDVIHFYVSVDGIKNGKYLNETFYKKIESDSDMTAIERATSAGVCSWIWEIYYNDVKKGFVRQEDFHPSDNNPFIKVYY